MRPPLLSFWGGILFHAASLVSSSTAQQAVLSSDDPFATELVVLRSALSDDAHITLPGSPTWDAVTIGAASPRISPGFIVSVQIATEEDVQRTIEFANRLSLPFLATSGKHGWPSTLNALQNGVQIDLRGLRSVEVHPSGKTAKVGGGILQHELVSALAAEGKLAPTGVCECVSLVGPMLGGGRGFLQGRHGLASDGLVGARVVLGNGSVVEVSERDEKGGGEKADLWWGLRGMGHNLGVVTSVDVKVHDEGDTRWGMNILKFPGSHLEHVLETWNRLEGEDRELLSMIAVIMRNPEMDEEKPSINLQIIYEEQSSSPDYYSSSSPEEDLVVPDTTDTTFTEAFLRHHPLSSSSSSSSTQQNIYPGNRYSDIFKLGGYSHDGLVCQKNRNILGFPHSSSQWDIPATRRAFNLFTDFTSDERFAGSVMLFESYGHKGIREMGKIVDSAVAPEEREMGILASPMMWWDGDDVEARRKVEKFGREWQGIMRGEEKKRCWHSYVGYANGDEESMEEIYGCGDEARLERMKKVKREWDPEGKFGFYNPIR